MSNTAVPQCTHIKTNGEVCGSPAVSGTEFCYHHSAVKTALAKPHGKAPYEGFAPIPFVFPEDRASMQINFFLLLQAFNEQRIDQKTFRLMLSMLKAMSKNLGKTGSLVEDSGSAHPAGASESASQQERVQGPGAGDQKQLVSKKAADGLESLVDLKASAIAPESCFSTDPKKPVSKSGNDIFRISTLDLAGRGFRHAAQPLTR